MNKIIPVRTYFHTSFLQKNQLRLLEILVSQALVAPIRIAEFRTTGQFVLVKKATLDTRQIVDQSVLLTVTAHQTISDVSKANVSTPAKELVESMLGARLYAEMPFALAIPDTPAILSLGVIEFLPSKSAPKSQTIAIQTLVGLMLFASNMKELVPANVYPVISETPMLVAGKIYRKSTTLCFA